MEDGSKLEMEALALDATSCGGWRVHMCSLKYIAHFLLTVFFEMSVHRKKYTLSFNSVF